MTIPRATAGNMGAMAIMAGTVVVVVTGPDTAPVIAPPVAAPPPDTTVCRRLGTGPSMEARSGSGGRGVDSDTLIHETNSNQGFVS